MTKINFAIVGCGRIAQRHAEHISNVGNLISVCDISKLKADELAELIIEILKYKKILSNDNDYSLKQLKSFVDRIHTGKQDKIDKIVIKSFDLMSAYKLEQLKLETKL